MTFPFKKANFVPARPTGRYQSLKRIQTLFSLTLCTIQMNINYNNRKFRPVSNSDNGEVSSDMIFHYKQIGDILTCSYEGQNIIKGHLIGLVDKNGSIEMSYHQVNKNGELKTGICNSKPEQMKSGEIRLQEEWQWTSGDKSKGNSILEEL